MLGVRSSGAISRVAIGDPGIRPNIAEEFLDRLLGASGMGQEASVLAVVEDPKPPASLADAKAGLVGTDHAARQQPGADGGAGCGEGLARSTCRAIRPRRKPRR